MNAPDSSQRHEEEMDEPELTRDVVMANEVKSYAEGAIDPGDEKLIADLLTHGENELSLEIKHLVTEARNIAHRTYHIIEDMEDSGLAQAIRRKNCLAVEAGKVKCRLLEAREKARQSLLVRGVTV